MECDAGRCAGKQCGVDMDAIGEAQRERENAAAYLELHIEQGPVLERMDLPLAVVSGDERRGAACDYVLWAGGAFGVDADDGSRDALAAAAKLALEIRRDCEEACRCGLHDGVGEDFSGDRDGGGGAM